jgi:glutamyl-tRNA synthetase
VLAVDFMQILEDNNVACTIEKAEAICGLLKERVTFPGEFWTSGQYFFFPPNEYDAKVIKKKWNEEAKSILSDYSRALVDLDTLSPELALNTMNAVLESHGVGLGKVMQALRVVITGLPGGPDLMGIIAVLGPQEAANRIESAIKKIG